jgi:hypothetical protein
MVTPSAFYRAEAPPITRARTQRIFLCGEVFQSASTTQQNEFSAVRVFKISKNRRKNFLNLFALKPLICDCRAESRRNFFLNRKIVLAFFRFLCYMEHRTVESFRFSRMFSNDFGDEEGVSDCLNLSKAAHARKRVDEIRPMIQIEHT